MEIKPKLAVLSRCEGCIDSFSFSKKKNTKQCHNVLKLRFDAHTREPVQTEPLAAGVLQY